MKRFAGTTIEAYWRCESCTFLKNGLFSASSAAILSQVFRKSTRMSGRRAQDAARRASAAAPDQRLGVLLLPLGPPDEEGLVRRALDHLLVLRREALPDVDVEHAARRSSRSRACRACSGTSRRSGSPSRRSSTPPTHSAQSITPRCADGMISPPGMLTVVMPMRCHTLRGDAGLAALHALEVGEVLDRPLEPAERLRARRQDREPVHVQLELLLVELAAHLDAAAVVHPAHGSRSCPCRRCRPGRR